MFETPILLVTFNRPNHTREVWNVIKRKKPMHIYVFQDGARNDIPADVEKCAAVRAIFEEPFDWECDFKAFYSKENLGCGKGPATAISWFFENVEKGIIIEDDAVPADDFFLYAEELLDKYENSVDVRAIGSMKIDAEKYGNASYYFSMMNRNLCAWATWRRAWNDFDYYMSDVNMKQVKKAFSYYKSTKKEYNYWLERLKEIQKDRLNESSWDMQFLFSIWLNKGVGIMPNVNLSRNIGFDKEATHTTNSSDPASNIPTQRILPIVHTDTKKINRKADLTYHKLYFAPFDYGISGIKRVPNRVNKRIKNFFGKEGSWFNF